MQIKEIVEYLDERFPKSTACDFDQNIIGLTIGTKNNEVKKVLLSLDLTLDVAKQAKNIGASLIITHHPFIFNPITKILFDSPQGRIIKFMCDNNISLYSMHTNLDVAVNGVDDTLANMLDIKYSHSEAIKEDMLRYGEIKEMPLKELVEVVKSTFKLSGVRVVGDLNKKIRTLGILGGSGGSISSMNEAIKYGCDCYITGEIHHDKGIYAHDMDLALIEVNHGIEKFVFNSVILELEKKFGKIFTITDINTDPFISL